MRLLCRKLPVLLLLQSAGMLAWAAVEDAPLPKENADPALIDRSSDTENPSDPYDPRIAKENNKIAGLKEKQKAAALKALAVLKIQNGRVSKKQARRYGLRQTQTTDQIASDQGKEEQDYASDYNQNLKNRQYLTGNWGGLRSKLASHGFTFDASYTGEAAHNWRGSPTATTRHASQLELATTVDLEKLWNWNGSSFQLTYTNYRGQNLITAANLNLLQQVQEVYNGDSYWELTQFWINTATANNKWQFKYGRMSIGEDFSNTNCDFQNITLCGPIPNNIVGDYWYAWPISEWAFRAYYTPNSSSYLVSGVYQVDSAYMNPSYERTGGWKLNNPQGTQGVLVPLEYGKSVTIRKMPGTYAIGGWYTSADGQDLFLNQLGQPLAIFGGVPMQRARYGGYINIQQQLTGASSAVGWNAFFSGVVADRSTASTNYSAMVALEYYGPFHRKNDSFGIGTGFTHVNGREVAYEELYNAVNPQNPTLVYAGNEWVSEIFYNWAPINSVNLRPNIQYIKPAVPNNPNGNVLVGGLKYIIQF